MNLALLVLMMCVAVSLGEDTSNLGQEDEIADNLFQKWSALWGYLNMVKLPSDADVKTAKEALTVEDFLAFRDRLRRNTAFASVADQIAALYYPKPVQRNITTATLRQYLGSLRESYQKGGLHNLTQGADLYDLLTGIPDTAAYGNLGGAPLKNKALEYLEVVLERMTSAQADDYIKKIASNPSLYTITRSEMRDAVVTYMSDPNTPVADLPLFGGTTTLGGISPIVARVKPGFVAIRVRVNGKTVITGGN